MKKWFAVFCVVVMAGCTGAVEKKESAGRPVLTVSILPQEYIVQQIAGDAFDITVLVPDGSGPETYEPTARQMQEIHNSKAAFITGLLDFEKSWMPKVAELNPGLKVVNLSEGLHLIGEEEHEGHGHAMENLLEEHEGHHHSGIDPHIWLSVKEIKNQLPLILETLIELDSANKPLFTANYNRFSRYLDSVDNIISEKMGTAAGKVSFMIYHPALSYFARDYGVEQIPIELGGKEPSPVYMKELIDVARGKGISTIYYSQQFERRSAETIAGQLGLKLAVFNPLEPDIPNNLLRFTNSITGNETK